MTTGVCVHCGAAIRLVPQSALGQRRWIRDDGTRSARCDDVARNFHEPAEDAQARSGLRRYRITFYRKQFASVVVGGFPSAEAARVQAEATPALVAGDWEQLNWHEPLLAHGVQSVEEISE